MLYRIVIVRFGSGTSWTNADAFPAKVHPRPFEVDLQMRRLFKGDIGAVDEPRPVSELPGA
jgi:hypothetical protein